MAKKAPPKTIREIDTVVMSGGAPQSPLMAGFLYELLKRGKTFRNFHTSGAGALMALLLIAPKDGNPCKALKSWVEAGVADEIYAGLPVNFKLFRKPGPFSSLFRLLAQRFHVPREGVPAAPDDPVKEVLADWLATPRDDRSGSPSDRDAIDRMQDRLSKLWTAAADPKVKDVLLKAKDPTKRFRDVWLTSWLKTDSDRRLYNDLVDLWFSALTPSTLTYRSKGLAAALPFLDEIVDFKKSKRFGGHLCVNAYNMTADAKLDKEDRRDRAKRNKAVMRIFDQSVIDAQHIRAAFSMPFIYPPARIGDDFYSEGADHQPINFHTLEAKGERRTVVLLDVLAELEDLLVRTPRDLWDAYVISIMTPVVALAHGDIEEFEEEHPDVKLIPAEWNVPPEFQPYLMDWSYSNLDKLFEVGREAGKLFLDGDGTPKHPAYKNHLPSYKDVFGSEPPKCD
jgi:predicted acylesterase/phospholipase RssA